MNIKDDMKPRMRGIIASVKDNFGFIRSQDHSELLFYHVNETENKQQFDEGDEVEFYLVPDTHAKVVTFILSRIHYNFITGKRTKGYWREIYSLIEFIR
jgi:cold shock CspA family protein